MPFTGSPGGAIIPDPPPQGRPSIEFAPAARIMSNASRQSRTGFPPATRITSNQSHRSQRGRRYSVNSLEGQRGTLQTSKNTLHGDLSIRDRLHHFTLAWFTCTMSTGGIALLLSDTPHQFRGLKTIGNIIYIFDIVLFILFTALITTRFLLFPKTFHACITHPTESLFLPAFLISIVNIISNTATRGIPHCGAWLVTTLRILFWIYVAITFIIAVGQYFFLFSGKQLTIQSMTPQWILPIFPIMLTGTLASVMGSTQPPDQALPMLIAGITFQGLGMMIASFMFGPYLSRLMVSGLPSPNTRPGMFIAVGPPSFTGLALLGISSSFSSIYPSYTSISGISHPELIPDIFRIIALSTAIFLWATAAWFWAISFVSVVHGIFTGHGLLRRGKGRWKWRVKVRFHMVWWALVFPNVGWTVCTVSIGQALESEGVKWVGSAMTVVLVVVWLVVGAAHVRAVVKREILWPGKDEDHDQ